jgi:hypothetical protein
MRKWLLTIGVLGCLGMAHAEDAPVADGRPHVRKLKPKKGVVLNEAQQKLLNEANAAFEKGYTLLMNDNDPGAAVAELRKALSISKQLGILGADPHKLAGIMPGNETGTQFEKIETSGGLESVVEIGAQIGIKPPPELDYGLHKRQIIKKNETDAKKIEAEQKSVTQELEMMAAAGGGGGEPPKPDEQQKTNPQQQQQPGGEQPQNQPNVNAQKDQQTANQNLNGKAEPDAKGTQTANQNQNGPQDPNAKPETNGAQTTNAQGKAEALANRQESIADDLKKIAGQLAELKKNGGGKSGTDKAAEEFLKAAAQAQNTAQMIRDGKTAQAAAASKDVEKKIQQALNNTGMAGAEALDKAVAELGKQLDSLQKQQQNMINQAQQAGKGEGGAPLPEAAKQERARALALEESKLKAQIDDAQKAATDLAAAGGEGADQNNQNNQRSSENTAREELGKAAAALQKNRASKAVVNATMKLGDGDTQGATKAMAEVQNALNTARNRVEAANTALQGGDDARLQRDFNQFKELAGQMRRMEATAKGAAGQTGKGEPQANAGKPNADGNDQNGKTGEGKQAGKPTDGQDQAGKNGEGKDPAGKQKGEGKDQGADGSDSASKNEKGDAGNAGELSASWAQVLNKSSEQIRQEMQRILPRLQTAAPQQAAELKEMLKQNPSFERDFNGSMEQVKKMLVAVQNMESVLSRTVEKEQEGKAMRNYIKDEIPASYKGVVAAYYEELAKEEK